MTERGARRGAGAPFYAPPRRKTSAEIISEARAALYADTSSSSGSGAPGSNGVLRSLRTRRPFTPRDPQRTLFADREKKKDGRPPSAFNLKYLSLAEGVGEATSFAIDTRIASINEDHIKGVLLTEPQSLHVTRKKVLKTRSDRVNESWNGFPKLPHLNGRSKPLHRRNTTGPEDETKSEYNLLNAISVTRPLGAPEFDAELNGASGESATKSLSPEVGGKRRNFAGSKSQSCDFTHPNAFGDIAVRHLSVQLPNASSMGRIDGLSLLEIAEALAEKSKDVERVLMLMELLQNTIEKSPPTNSLRDLTLRSLYTYIDNNDARVLVAIARAMLTLRVTGAHLAAACKLVFKIARNDKNDHFFRTTNLLELLIEGCGRADPASESECCVYGAGALRFLALEPRLRALAHRAGALHLAALHLKIFNNVKSESPRSISEHSTHALYQLTGALRNLAGGVGRETREFVASGALGELVNALEIHRTDRDVVTNVVRCLSVLSCDESCIAWLCASAGAARALVAALAQCAARAALAVRLAYTLGNMAAADDLARDNIYNEEGGVDVLLTVLESYTERNDRDMRPDIDTDPDLHLLGSDLGGSDGSNEDVLIKTVRVVANLCLAERVGRGLAANHAERTIKALIACLGLAEKASRDISEVSDIDVEGSPHERSEELATACLAAINNLSFYVETPDDYDKLGDTMDELCRVTCSWLSVSAPCGCEALRALGNLSRSARAAQLVVLHHGLADLGPYLQHEDIQVRCAAAGLLVNVCGAGCGGAGGAAADALARAATVRDPRAAALLARAVWNAAAHKPLAHKDAVAACNALDAFIDDDSVLESCLVLRAKERRASDPEVMATHHGKVKFDIEDRIDEKSIGIQNDMKRKMTKSNSVDNELNIDCSGDEATACSGEDLGFEDGDLYDYSCECEPCKRMTAWEELVSVAVPLLEKLRPPRADASVGTD